LLRGGRFVFVVVLCFEEKLEEMRFPKSSLGKKAANDAKFDYLSSSFFVERREREQKNGRKDASNSCGGGSGWERRRRRFVVSDDCVG
jgi:hypothetical protein